MDRIRLLQPLLSMQFFLIPEHIDFLNAPMGLCINLEMNVDAFIR